MERETSFDFEAVQYLLDLNNITTPDREEASTEYEKSNIFGDVTTNNFVSFKKIKDLTRICKKVSGPRWAQIQEEEYSGTIYLSWSD